MSYAGVKGKGSKARNVGHDYKLFYHRDTRNRNGVGIILREERDKPNERQENLT